MVEVNKYQEKKEKNRNTREIKSARGDVFKEEGMINHFKYCQWCSSSKKRAENQSLE